MYVCMYVYIYIWIYVVSRPEFTYFPPFPPTTPSRSEALLAPRLSPSGMLPRLMRSTQTGDRGIGLLCAWLMLIRRYIYMHFYMFAQLVNIQRCLSCLCCLPFCISVHVLCVSFFFTLLLMWLSICSISGLDARKHSRSESSGARK